MIVNQASLAQLRVGFSAAFNKGVSSMTQHYGKIATTVPSVTSIQEYPWLGQIPGMREWVGEREIQKLTQHMYGIKNKTWEQTIGVPRDAIEDDVYGMYTVMMQNMGESAGRHPDELVFGILKSGFDARCYDEKPFFSDVHDIGGHRYSNLGTTELSVESYAAARTEMMSICGEAGKPLGLVPDLLVVSPASETKAREILCADFINGSSNVYKGTAQHIVVPDLADVPGAWFLLCTGRFLKPLIYQERKKIKFTSLVKEDDPNVFLNNEYLYGADGRDNAGYGFWQMAYGSDGTTKG